MSPTTSFPPGSHAFSLPHMALVTVINQTSDKEREVDDLTSGRHLPGSVPVTHLIPVQNPERWVLELKACLRNIFKLMHTSA